MVVLMRLALVTTVLALCAIALPGAASATSSAGAGGARSAGRATGPSASAIAQAIRQAESSSSLWATINICNSKADPDTLGVRGQMPALGFSAKLVMTVRVTYWSSAKQRFEPIAGPTASRTLVVGGFTSGLQQDGLQFQFPPKTGRLSATITFAWKRAGAVLGQTVRAATAGHPDADFGSPAHYSAAQCTIG